MKKTGALRPRMPYKTSFFEEFIRSEPKIARWRRRNGKREQARANRKKGAKMERMGAKSEPKRSQRVRKGSQRVPKGRPKGAKGSQKGAKERPKWIQKSPWAPGSILGAKSGCRDIFLGAIFGPFSMKNRRRPPDDFNTATFESPGAAQRRQKNEKWCPKRCPKIEVENG